MASLHACAQARAKLLVLLVGRHNIRGKVACQCIDDVSRGSASKGRSECTSAASRSPLYRTARNEACITRHFVSADGKRAVLFVSSLLAGCSPGVALAEEIPSQWLEIVSSWLDSVQALGPLAPLALLGSIALFECVPFFPTQPLALASGLLFGATAGAGVNLVGTCCAAGLAFYLSRTVGRGLANAVVKEETGNFDNSKEKGFVAAKLEAVQHTIENGSIMQQFTAIVLLRLTPVVPFSASNYVLGLSPVGAGPFFAATFLGMTVWSTVFASIGGAGRTLLQRGGDISAILAELSEDAGEATEKALIGALVIGVSILAISMLPKKYELTFPDPMDLAPRRQDEKSDKSGDRLQAHTASKQVAKK